MPKKHSESNTTKKSSKESKKNLVGFETMSGLKQEERYSTKPEDFHSEIHVKATFRYKKRKATLSEGILTIMKDKGPEVKNVVDLGLSVVNYQRSTKQLRINNGKDIFRLRADDEHAFKDWIDHIRNHRLYRQAKLLYKNNSVGSVAVSVPQSSKKTVINKPSVDEVEISHLRELSIELKKNLHKLQQVVSDGNNSSTMTKADVIRCFKTCLFSTNEVHKVFEELFDKTFPPKRNSTCEDVEEHQEDVHEQHETKSTATKVSSHKTPVSTVAPEKKKIPIKDEGEDESEESTEIQTPVATLPPTEEEVAVPTPRVPIVYRNKLPVPMPNLQLSVWAILKQTIGKDLSKISFPVELFEPLTLLQVLCEELEYAALLNQAVKLNDVRMRMALVAAFAVSRYSSTESRVFRKPFNPIEGETYENVRSDLGWWYFAEQVSHNPAINAVHAKGADWELSQSVSYDLSFWGRSIQAEPKSPVDLKLNSLNETYRWNKVKTSVNNLFGGTRYIDHYGDMLIKCSNHYSCKLTFKKSNHEVVGNILDGDGKVISKIDGHWSDSLKLKHSNGESSCLWAKNPISERAKMYYGFTDFAMTLNELTPEMKEVLPNTDSRFRTDSRMLEDGKIDEAKKQKELLENEQRQRRKLREYKPKWFKVETKSNEKLKKTYEFNHQYWEARKSKFAGEKLEKLWPSVI